MGSSAGATQGGMFMYYRQVALLEQGCALCFLPVRQNLSVEYLQTFCAAGARMRIVFSAVRQNLFVE